VESAPPQERQQVSNDEEAKPGAPAVVMVASNIVDELEQAVGGHRTCCSLDKRVEALVLSLVGEHYLEAHLHGKPLPGAAEVLARVTKYVEKYTSPEIQEDFLRSVPTPEAGDGMN
jgi:hypothetical protein